jgi:hypothetical protein
MPLPSMEMILIAARAMALALAFLGFALAFRHWRKATERDTQRVFEQLDLILGELRELSAQVQSQAALGATAQAETADGAARFAITPSSAGPRGYEVAVRLAKTGASREELMSHCGISRHEADLLLRLHGEAKEQKSDVVEQHAPQKDATPAMRPRLSVVG